MPETSEDDFYQFYPSNAETEIYAEQKNNSAGFTILRRNAMHFENPDEWSVGLAEIFVPGTYYNVFEPFNKKMLEIYRVPSDDHWRWGKDFEKYLEEKGIENTELVCEISVDPGFYTTKLFCDVVNDIAGKFLSHFDNDKGANIALKEEENRQKDEAEMERIREMIQDELTRFHQKNPIPDTITEQQLKNILQEEKDKLVQLMRLEWQLFLESRTPASVGEPAPKLPPVLLTDDEIKTGVLLQKNKKEPGVLYDIGSSTGADSAYAGPSFGSWQTTPSTTEARVNLESLRDKITFVGPVSSVSAARAILPSERQGRKRTREELEKNSRYDLIKIKPHTHKLRINLPPAHFIVCRNERVQKLLGWQKFDDVIPRMSGTVKEKKVSGRKSVVFGNTSVQNLSRVILPETCDFGRNNRSLFVYCNLVKPTDIGNSLCPILRVVDVNVTSMTKSPVLHRTFFPIQYHPLSNSQFLDIQFLLLNGLGEAFPFQHGESSLLVLHFKHRFLHDKKGVQNTM